MAAALFAEKWRCVHLSFMKGKIIRLGICRICRTLFGKRLSNQLPYTVPDARFLLGNTLLWEMSPSGGPVCTAGCVGPLHLGVGQLPSSYGSCLLLPRSCAFAPALASSVSSFPLLLNVAKAMGFRPNLLPSST